MTERAIATVFCSSGNEWAPPVGCSNGSDEETLMLTDLQASAKTFISSVGRSVDTNHTYLGKKSRLLSILVDPDLANGVGWTIENANTSKSIVRYPVYTA